MSGWVQLHRKLLDNPIFKNHKLLQTFLYCLLRASHKEHDTLIGETIVHLKKGQLATGRKAISLATGLTEQNVRTSLSKLEALSILTINPTTKYSVISISNWESYQQTNQQVTNSQPTSNQQVTTNNNVNKGKNVNNKDANEIFDHWKSVMKKNNLSKLNDKRLKAIKGRLKEGYSVDQIKMAINGCSMTPHNMGQNDNNKKYDDIELICRDGVNVERFANNFNQSQQENKPRRAFGQ